MTVLFNIRIGNQQFLIGSQLSAFFNINQSTFFSKNPRMWKRLASKKELQILSSKLGAPFDALPTPVMFVRSEEFLPKLQSIKQLSFTVQQVQLDEAVPVQSTTSALQQLNVKIEEPVSHTEAEYIKALHQQYEMNVEIIEGKREDKVEDYQQRRLLLRSRTAEPFKMESKNTFAKTEALLNGKPEEPEILVPIRIDLEFDNVKYKDTFTWNLTEKFITPEMFASFACEDYGLTHSVFGPAIARSIKDQIVDYSNYLKPHVDSKDLRILIKLDVTVGNYTLVDQFEWDLSSNMDPELFAEILASDLALSGEFK
jgi:hypothetical protein